MQVASAPLKGGESTEARFIGIVPVRAGFKEFWRPERGFLTKSPSVLAAGDGRDPVQPPTAWGGRPLRAHPATSGRSDAGQRQVLVFAGCAPPSAPPEQARATVSCTAAHGMNSYQPLGGSGWSFEPSGPGRFPTQTLKPIDEHRKSGGLISRRRPSAATSMPAFGQGTAPRVPSCSDRLRPPCARARHVRCSTSSLLLALEARHICADILDLSRREHEVRHVCVARPHEFLQHRRRPHMG